MKRLIYFFTLLLLVVVAGVAMRQYPAYVFITFGHFVIKTSLWFFLVALLVGTITIYEILHFLYALYKVPRRMGRFAKNRNLKKLHILRQKTLLAFFEQDWSKSEAYCLGCISRTQNPYFYYLGIAYIALEAKAFTKGAHYLVQARKHAKPLEATAIDILRVRLLLAEGQYAQAKRYLVTLQSKIGANHPFILQGLQAVVLALKDWQALYDLMPRIWAQKKHIWAVDPLLEQQVLKLLEEAASLERLETLWERIPRSVRKTPNCIAHYARGLIKHKQMEKATCLLNKALKHEKHIDLLSAYALIFTEHSALRVSQLERWLKKEPENPDLHLYAGLVYMHYRFLGKAKYYFQKTLKYKPSQNVYLLLGEVFEALQDKQSALDSYKLGLQL